MKMKFLGNKKGQGAMEYLMTYGWAILVVMIVGVVLWQLGIFGGQGGANKATGFSGSKIGAIDASIKCNETFLTIQLTNQGGSTLSSIMVNKSSRGYTETVGGVGDTGSLTPNEAKELSIGGPTGLVVGDSMTTDIVITYNERVAGTVITRTQSGMIMCTVES